MEPSYTIGGNIKWYIATVGSGMIVPQKIKLLYDPAVPLLGIYSVELKAES